MSSRQSTYIIPGLDLQYVVADLRGALTFFAEKAQIEMSIKTKALIRVLALYMLVSIPIRL